MLSELLYSFSRPLLFACDAEDSHHRVLTALRRGEKLGLNGLAGLSPGRVAQSPRRVMGLDFPNQVGLAAGLDKDGACIDGLASLGFGFIEIGTVTPRAQPGNPRPRMFRLPEAQALINRMGFNNGGLERFCENVAASRYRGILGLNIGKNADTPIERAVDDYLIGLRGVYPHASYVTVNISSPNTKNLRQLQGASELDELLGALKAEQTKLADQHGRYVPLTLKIAPDLDADQIRNISDALLRHRIDGVIATNTTIARDAVRGLRHSEEAGGLSGAPVRESANAVIRALKKELRDDIPIIGVGGILSGDDAQEKIDAGASLVQLYTGLIYRGPALVAECARTLQRNSAASR